MNSNDLDLLKNELVGFINSLNRGKFDYLPALKGVTKIGKNINLGFNCYVIKCLYMLDEWDNLNTSLKDDWVNYINSFQSINKNFPRNSFVDNNYIKFYNHGITAENLKFFTKNILNYVGFNYESKKVYLDSSIRAETKQAISTLKQINKKNRDLYLEFPKTENELNSFLNALNWEKPWSAGAQFASLCVFADTQLQEKENELCKRVLINFVDNLVDSDSGFYFKGNMPTNQEIINGTMKIITGLDWINHQIHYPEKIIDQCLKFNINSEGCDIVDIVYVLYKCSLITDYKKKDIDNYFDIVLFEIMKHYLKGDKGFSYFIDKSQTYYYGLKITTGMNTADIHGTTLLLWAISMIDNFKHGSNRFNILKP